LTPNHLNLPVPLLGEELVAGAEELVALGLVVVDVFNVVDAGAVPGRHWLYQSFE
jgi:hypothetical protein